MKAKITYSLEHQLAVQAQIIEDGEMCFSNLRAFSTISKLNEERECYHFITHPTVQIGIMRLLVWTLASCINSCYLNTFGPHFFCCIICNLFNISHLKICWKAVSVISA